MPDEPTAPSDGTSYPAEAPPSGEPARSQKRLRELPATILLPRDKLLKYGVAGLSQAELVAVLLGSGTKGKSVIRIAEDLVGRHGGQKLVTLSLDEWTSHRGVGRVKAAQMLAAFELGRRLLAPSAEEPVSIGSLNTTRTHPREVLQPAIVNSALAFILVHNHPSGSLDPSRDDVEFTRTMARAGDLMGISLYDHIIVSRRGFVSMKERGLL